MTNLTHAFYSVKKEFMEKKYSNNTRISEIRVSSQECIVHDDIISFIFKTLYWIRTKTANNSDEIDGLSYHGRSIIYPEQLKTLKNIIDAWVIVFENAPEKVIFDYQVKNISEKKVKIIGELLIFASFLEKTIIGEGYIIHVGI